MPAHNNSSDTRTEQAPPQPPHVRQLALQFAAVFIVLSLAWPFFILRNEPLPWPGTSLAIGSVALLIATLSRQDWWWKLIHALFAPLAWGIHSLSIDPEWFLLAFILLMLIYRGAVSGQIPLYLSNSASVNALVEITSDRTGMHFLDLGSGIGSIVAPLARKRLDANLTGIENAPVVWLIGYLRTLFLGNCHWRWGSLWNTSLSDFDVVYAFLSPAAMPALWKKVELEMRPGSLFISNSFPVPGVEASRMIEIDDGQTRFYCYLR